MGSLVLILSGISSSYIGVGSLYVGEWGLVLMLSGISSSDVGVGSLVLMLEIGISLLCWRGIFSSYVREWDL